jgi:uncharacterized protein YndB with AHSA1/START domain
VEIHDEQAAIIFERRFAHPIEVVWAAITESSHLAAWFGPTTMDGRAGG